MIFQGFEGVVLVERVNHLICKGYGSQEERRAWAEDAVKYLCSIGSIGTPHWDALVSASCLEPLPEISSYQPSPVLQKLIAHEYVEAIALLEIEDVVGLTHCRNLESITEVLILARNFKELEDIEYQVAGISSSRQDNLSKEEANALRRIRILLCGSFYLREKYFDCCSCFFKILTSDDKMMNILEEPSRNFFTNSELLMMVEISTLLAIPLDSYDDFLQLEDLAPFHKICPSLYQCLEFLINTSFGKFFQIWHGSISMQCEKSFFLDQCWKSAQCLMREKICFFYLRISNQIEISYLSRILNVEESLTKKEVEHLIDSMHLSFKIQGDTICYEPYFFLKSVVRQLQSNGDLISSKLEFQKMRNREMRLLLQKMIIGTNENGQNVISDRSARSSRSNLRQQDNEMMDVDEFNDMSDTDSQSVIEG